MASVSNIRLQVGRGSGNREFADIRYRIHFSTAERQQNLLFHEWVVLYERDDGLDTYVVGADASIRTTRFANGNLDDFIGTIRDSSVRSNGNSFVDRHFRRD